MLSIWCLAHPAKQALVHTQALCHRTPMACSGITLMHGTDAWLATLARMHGLPHSHGCMACLSPQASVNGEAFRLLAGHRLPQLNAQINPAAARSTDAG
jgi:hypothetical protein